MKKWNPILLSLENEKEKGGCQKKRKVKENWIKLFREEEKINEESNFRFLLAVTTVWNRH